MVKLLNVRKRQYSGSLNHRVFEIHLLKKVSKDIRLGNIRFIEKEINSEELSPT